MKETYTTIGIKLMMTVMFVTGALLFLYPFVSNVVNKHYDYQRITAYQQQSQHDLDAKRQQKKAQHDKETKVNQTIGLPETLFEEVGSKQSLSDKKIKEHLIGVIRIPKIAVQLPLFDETTSEFLQEGATLLPGTSYPTGGKGSHSVITGHTGLPDQLLFTDLDQLVIGDMFYVSVLGKDVAYEVDQIKTVLPDDLTHLHPQPDTDLLTLITCTPYMVNTHRLLVRGHRVPLPKDDLSKAEKEMVQRNRQQLIGYMGLMIGLICFLLKVIIKQVKLYRTSQKNYRLDVLITQNGRPVKQVAFKVVSHLSKHPICVGGKALILTSNDQGRLRHRQLKGKLYHLLPLDSDYKGSSLKMKVKHFHDDQFSVKGTGGFKTTTKGKSKR